jgi:nucleoid DNA-binding protein
MNQNELIAVVAEKMEVSKAEAKRTIDTVLGTIIDGVVANGEAVLPGLGKLKVKDVKGRSGVSKLQGVEKAWKTEDHKTIRLSLSAAGKELV